MLTAPTAPTAPTFFTSHKDPFSLVTAYLPSKDIGNLRGTTRQVNVDLTRTAKFAAISDNNPRYSEEECNQVVHELTQYASELADGCKEKQRQEIQNYVDGQRSKLADEETANVKMKIDQEARLTEAYTALNAILAEDEKCESASKKVMCRQDYEEKLAVIREANQKINAQVNFTAGMISRKLELLSLVHLVRLNEVQPGCDFSEISYEANLLNTLQTKIDSEIKACTVSALERAVTAAKNTLNSRLYLAPFTDSPDTISSYLKRLGDSLASAAKEKYLPPTPRRFDCIVS